MSGMKATYKFHGEVVHSFESFPSASDASNEYAPPSGEEQLNHSYSGKMDGGKPMPELKSTGPYAALVTSIKVRSLIEDQTNGAML
ncbi:hypothetical protein P3T76_003525 [Phytophthora citrophthora]|uniref:Uncharacterized protein n=1 Tax=Phytophthora citrophthora TaxID=4793 RepID=A0AAD9LRX5_9STRA|nr:hypothetical protein P3T76_003525 [Phytophthora citrophthora]